MSTYYTISGEITIPREVFEKEREGLLKELMQWGPDTDGEGEFTLYERDFEFVIDFASDIYRNLGNIENILKSLCSAYPSQIEVSVFLSSTDGCLVAERYETNSDGDLIAQRLKDAPKEKIMSGKTHEFRDSFWTPYEQYKGHIGKKFEVLRMLSVEEIGNPEVEGQMFEIKLEDGTEIDAWYEEIYQKSCKVNGELI